ncbi:MAG TPA: energy-coupling factor ABC transporter permease [Gallionella sp.]|nr:energy-coupling factor ABC transporter permease [Gallionella sp.]
MSLPPEIFPPALLWLSNLVFIFLLARAIWFAPWRRLDHSAAQSNAVVGLTLGAFVFWQLSPGVRPGLHHHLLGATLLMLMFGREIAICSLSLVLLASMLYTHADLIAFGINGLVLIALPVFFSELVLRFSQHRLPKHFMIYVLGNGFLCAILAMALVVLATALLLAIFGSYKWSVLFNDYLAFTPVICFAEGFTTGMLITSFVAFKPDAVATFSDEDYLKGK